MKATRVHDSHDERFPWGWALPAVAVSLILHAALFVAVAIRQPAYLTDHERNPNPDALHFVTLGRNLLDNGAYSRSVEPPYPPDMVRPPGYPVFVGLLDKVGEVGAIYVAQALLQAGACLLLFAMVWPHFGKAAALCGSILLGADLVLAIYDFEVMSEPLCNFLTLAAMWLILPISQTLARGEAPRWSRLACGGILLGLVTLTRPAGQFLPFVLATCFVLLGWWYGRWARAFAAAALLLVAALPLPALWVARNNATLSVPHLTTADAINNVYYVGAGAYQVHFNITVEEARAKICEEYGLTPYPIVANDWTSDHSVAELDRQMRGAQFAVMTRYPVDLTKASALALTKATLGHNANKLALMVEEDWTAPGVESLLAGSRDAWDRLQQNNSLLVGVFTVEVVQAMVVFLAALAGVIVALRDPQGRAAALLLFAVGFYLYATIVAHGLVTFFRMRVPVVPFFCVFAGIGVHRFLVKLNRTRSQCRLGAAGSVPLKCLKVPANYES
jgi:4-amino-4-deoxy-L-arabinose transferase-like glycosyltransferase